MGVRVDVVVGEDVAEGVGEGVTVRVGVQGIGVPGVAGVGVKVDVIVGTGVEFPSNSSLTSSTYIPVAPKKFRTSK